jgi:Domain of unknown function (DUF4349)
VTDAQLSDETLEELFSEAAAVYEVPADAFERVLSAAGETAQGGRRRRVPHPRLVAAGVLVIAAVGGASLWHGSGSGVEATPSAVNQDFKDSPALTNPAQDSLNSSEKLVGKGDLRAAALPPAEVKAATPGSTLAGLHGTTTTFGDDAGGATADAAKIVHTGSLTLTVAKGQVTAVLTRLTGLATGVGGYVAKSTTAESGDSPTGTVVLRVPAGLYDTVLDQARGYGTVVSTSSSGVDVTAQVTDQHARLTALTQTRDHYLTLLAKAKTIGETLSVQQRVDDAQTQIDQLQGQINVLADQASYGTLTATVSQKAAAVVATKPAPRQSGLSKAWRRAQNGFVTGVEALIARSGRGLLVLLVLAGTAVVLRLAWRVGRRRLV